MSERSTIQKAAILTVLERAPAPLGVARILSQAQKAVPGLSQATVYRVLKALLGREAIVAVQVPGESPLYEMAGKSHHHFFRCRRCERMYEVVGCEDLLKRLVPRGFRLESHEVFLFGLCASCKP